MCSTVLLSKKSRLRNTLLSVKGDCPDMSDLVCSMDHFAPLCQQDGRMWTCLDNSTCIHKVKKKIPAIQAKKIELDF